MKKKTAARERPVRSLDELLKEDAVKDWLAHAERDMFPKMKASSFSLTVWDKPDAKLTLEVGAAVVFDKPLLIIVRRGAVLPQNLRRIATEIVEVALEFGSLGMTEEDKQKVGDAIQRMVRKPS